MPWGRIIRETVGLTVIAAIAGAVVNGLRSDAHRLAWIGDYYQRVSSTKAQPSILEQVQPQARQISPLGASGPPSVENARQPAAPQFPALKPETKEDKTSSPAAESPGEKLRDVAPPKDPGLVFLEIADDVVRRMHEAGALFLDARRSSVYENAHIPGARNISVWEHDADAKVEGLVKSGIPIGRVIVTYCSGGNCRDAEVLAGKLSAVGFFNIYLYKGGFPDWQSRHWPVKQGGEP